MIEAGRGVGEAIVISGEGESGDCLQIKEGDSRIVMIRENRSVIIWDPEEGIYGFASRGKGFFVLEESKSIEDLKIILGLSDDKIIQQIAEYLGEL